MIVRYFIIEQDKSYTKAPRIVNSYKKGEVKLNTKLIIDGIYKGIGTRTLVDCVGEKDSPYIDIISDPTFMVSKNVKKILSKFEPNMEFKELVVLDKKNIKVKQYYIPVLDRFDCLSSDSILNLDKSVVKKMKLDLSKVLDKCLFTVSGVNSQYVIARLDFVESILRREAIGINLIEIETVGCIKYLGGLYE